MSEPVVVEADPRRNEEVALALLDLVVVLQRLAGDDLAASACGRRRCAGGSAGRSRRACPRRPGSRRRRWRCRRSRCRCARRRRWRRPAPARRRAARRCRDGRPSRSRPGWRRGRGRGAGRCGSRRRPGRAAGSAKIAWVPVVEAEPVGRVVAAPVSASIAASASRSAGARSAALAVGLALLGGSAPRLPPVRHSQRLAVERRAAAWPSSCSRCRGRRRGCRRP